MQQPEADGGAGQVGEGEGSARATARSRSGSTLASTKRADDVDHRHGAHEQRRRAAVGHRVEGPELELEGAERHQRDGEGGQRGADPAGVRTPTSLRGRRP